MEKPKRPIERLFLRLAAMYGSRFAEMWDGVPKEEVKRTWSQALYRYSLDEIGAALNDCLQHHPYPPTLPQFLALCRAHHRPESGPLALAHQFTAMPPDVAEKLAEWRRKMTAWVLP